MGRFAYADFIPIQLHLYLRLALISAFLPEGIICALPRRSARVVFGAVYGGEGGPTKAPERTGVRFALVKKCNLIVCNNKLLWKVSILITILSLFFLIMLLISS